MISRIFPRLACREMSSNFGFCVPLHGILFRAWRKKKIPADTRNSPIPIEM